MEGNTIFNNTTRAGEKTAFRPLVYICAPYSGDVEENTKRATAFAKYAYDKGNIPLTAHLLFPFMEDTNEEDRRTEIEKAKNADRRSGISTMNSRRRRKNEGSCHRLWE